MFDFPTNCSLRTTETAHRPHSHATALHSFVENERSHLNSADKRVDNGFAVCFFLHQNNKLETKTTTTLP